MNFFSAKIDNQKIILTIPDCVLGDVRRMFKKLKKTAVNGEYEIAGSAENFAMLDQISAQISAEENRNGLAGDTTVSTKKTTRKGTPSLPQMAKSNLPRISPVLTTISEATAMAPALGEVIAFVDEAMKRDGHQVSAVCIPQGAIPASLIADGGPILLMRFEETFVPMLETYSCLQPVPGCFQTLDLLSTGTVSAWEVDTVDDWPVVFGVEVRVFEQFYTKELVNGQPLERARVIMCAGDQVAFGGHFRDRANFARTLNSVIDFVLGQQYTVQQLIEAKKQADKYGRAPWLGNFFDGPAKGFALIPVLRTEEVLGQRRDTVH